MKIPKIPLAQTVIQLCKAKGIKHIVISPGSRNAPLTIGFTNDPFFTCYSIVDERCAAFFALGIAQQIKDPVVVVCTSGSALLNYFPAVAEAFYSDIPLVVISADRPKHLIGIGDGQTIDQNNVYGTHVLSSVNLEDDLSVEKRKTNNDAINSALNTAIVKAGPVHINCPFDEPLYETIDSYSVTVSESTAFFETETQTEIDFNELATVWNSAQKKIILVGVNPPQSMTTDLLDGIAQDESVIVFTETTSNLHHDTFFPSIDKIIAPLDVTELDNLKPDLLVTFGGMIVSKKIKAFLRQHQPKRHWHVDQKKANDTFFSLNRHIKMHPKAFFSKLLEVSNTTESNYRGHWKHLKTHRGIKHEAYLKKILFSDFTVFNTVLQSIPDTINLHLGNSSTVRYTQLFDINKTLKVFCNRGTSGIDGSTSTAIGGAVVSKEQSVFITGDLSFFYDSNALWNTYIPDDFRIIIVNNGGGGIFRILPGHKNSDNFDEYFETIHNLNAVDLCKMYKLDYVSAKNEKELERSLANFYELSSRPKLLEVFTPRVDNDTILLDYFEHIR